MLEWIVPPNTSPFRFTPFSFALAIDEGEESGQPALNKGVSTDGQACDTLPTPTETRASLSRSRHSTCSPCLASNPRKEGELKEGKVGVDDMMLDLKYSTIVHCR